MSAEKLVELDATIIKDDHEYESLLKSLDPKKIDMSVFSDIFNMDELKSAISKSLQKFLSECASDNYQFGEHDFNFDNDGDFESLLANLAPRENDKCSSDVTNWDAIKEHIFKCASHHKRAMPHMLMDIHEMVVIGLSRGDIRRDQLQMTVAAGAERIVELAYWYKIPLRSAPGERIRLKSDTLTFVRAITCFPHIASILLFKSVGRAKNGAKSVLASKQLPDAMKHSGFWGLIPKVCDPYLMKAYLFAHTAYMVDFGKLINPSDKRSLKELALVQLEYSKAASKAAVNEKLPLTDECVVGILRAVGLADAGVFKKIVDVCNNLCKVIGEPKLSFATAEKYHIKNNKICFFEDESKDVAAGEQAKIMVDSMIVKY